MGCGAYATDPLHNLCGVTGMTSSQDGLKATVHAAGELCVDNFSVFHDNFDLEVSLDTGHRVDSNGGFVFDSFCHNNGSSKSDGMESLPFRLLHRVLSLT